MKSYWTTFPLLVGALSVLPLAGYSQKTPENQGINPALLYYQAFLSVPHLDYDDHMLVFGGQHGVDWHSGKVRELVDGYGPAFDLLRRAGRSQVPCDWGVDLSEGPALELPIPARAKSLAHVARFRARHFLESGTPDEAVTDLLAAWALARNITTDRTGISRAVKTSLEVLLIGFVAEHFYLFDHGTSRALANGLDQLASGFTTVDAVQPERQWLIGSAVRRLRELRDTEQTDSHQLDQARELVQKWTESTERTEQIMAASGGTLDGLANYFEAAKQAYSGIEDLLGLTCAEFQEIAAARIEEFRNHENLLAREMLPGVLRMRHRELAVEVQMSMLHAAIAWKLRGRSGFESVKDQCSDRPFNFHRQIVEGQDRGFALASEFNLRVSRSYSAEPAHQFIRGHRETLIFVEQPGPPIITSGQRAGQLRVPPDKLLQQRYGLPD
jgi:hypothetical protein